MEVWECKTHLIKLVIEGTRRTFATSQGSFPNIPRCMLFLLGGKAGAGPAMVGELREGQFGDCVIVKEGD